MTSRSTVVYLSPVLNDDSAKLFSWINDRDTVVLSAPYAPVHLQNHNEWFDAIRRRSDAAIFGIRMTVDRQLIGVCQLHSIHAVHRSAELQIRIGEPGHRGKGYGREALELLLHYGFMDRNLHRTGLHVFADNQAARRIYLEAGFREEGCLREAAFIDGTFKNVVVMGLLREEFLAR